MQIYSVASSIWAALWAPHHHHYAVWKNANAHAEIKYIHSHGPNILEMIYVKKSF